MKYSIVKEPPTVGVVTPTIGTDKLCDAVESVFNQDYKGKLTHYVVIDGIQRDVNVRDTCSDYRNVSIIELPFNTGANGYYGHRIYAAMSQIVPEDYILFLDEDNLYEPDHVRSMVEAITEQDDHFGHSFRKIVSPKNEYLLDDDCESLGNWPIMFNELNGYLVDTSCFIFKNEFLKRYGHLWNSGWGGDRRFLQLVQKWSGLSPITMCGYTVRYRLDGNPGSVNQKFFEDGNQKTLDFYNGELPWKKTS